MKAAQISRYSKQIDVDVNEISVPSIKANEVRVKVKAAAVNPLEMLIMSGSIRLIQDYKFPQTLGNEISGIVDQVGAAVSEFKKGDSVYGRLPASQIGGFADYVAVNAQAIWHMPQNLDFDQAAAAPLTGLTAYQAFHEELRAQSGETVFIPGGSGSFGPMAVPIAKAMGLKVIVSGSGRAKEEMLAMGVDTYLNYKTENYWELVSDVDYVIDTLGANEIERELSVLRPGGKLVSLKAGPNKQFAVSNHFSWWKQLLFSLVGSKIDKLAKKSDVEYRFIFVRADGNQLREITKIIEENDIKPAVNPREFKIQDINEALNLVRKGSANGKVIIKF